MRPSEDLAGLRDFYREQLLDDIIPWWMEHAIDREHGGILTFIEDDGSVASTDRYMWSQLRALYIFSRLSTRVEPREEWLEVARGIYDYVTAHGRDDEGRWHYWLTAEGDVVEGPNSIYSDGFAIMGMTEFARATGEQQPIDIALETYQAARERLANPESYLTAPYAVPEGAKAHGVSMIFSSVFYELGRFLDDEEIMDAGYDHAVQVMDHFRRPEKMCLLEYTSRDGSVLDSAEGRVVVPGHAIESMWFQMHIFEHRGEPERIAQAVECVRWHTGAAWDPEWGGLVLAFDSEWRGEPAWEHAMRKFWWVHTETIYALLLSWYHSREQWCLDWHDRVFGWTFEHFPVPEHGEWTMRLTREGERPEGLLSLIPLPIKDPFHTPRALMLCVELLDEIEAEADA
ncbi:MAG: AGE family epimerase/isomerase [Armatimonadota bacterium]